MKTFLTSCVSADGDAINSMKAEAEEIEREDFESEVDQDSLKETETSLGYDDDFRMVTDWHVSYHRSTFEGKPCVYFVWSAIEHVFV